MGVGFVGVPTTFEGTKSRCFSVCNKVFSKKSRSNIPSKSRSQLSMIGFVDYSSVSESSTSISDVISNVYHQQMLLAIDIGPIKDVAPNTLALAAAITGGFLLASAIIIFITRV
mmetsp:Transcript_2931/g.5149  ORF Transcript_2931/g.5149 Transcript_2931/m.5149 type:complete len:114 (-) Transcript_2931:58-399(-)